MVCCIGICMIWRSVKRLYKNGCTSSCVDGPPIFIITIAVGGLVDMLRWSVVEHRATVE